MRAREQRKVEPRVAARLGLRVEGAAGDDERREVGGAAALADDAAGAGTIEAEEGGELAGRELFYEGEGGGDLVDVELGSVLALFPSLVSLCCVVNLHSC